MSAGLSWQHAALEELSLEETASDVHPAHTVVSTTDFVFPGPCATDWGTAGQQALQD